MLGGFAADHRGLLFADAFHEVHQLLLERLLLRDRHRLAHDAFAGELADDGGIPRREKLLQQ